MENLKLEIKYQFCKVEELPADVQDLINKAINATANSYAKYSNFHVGAALRLRNGHCVIGANQENASFPEGLCAERTAIFSSQANYPEQAIKAIAIAAKNKNGLLKSPITPCGGCRQVILEMEDRYKCDVNIYLYGTEGVYCFKSIKDLIPFSFVDENMH